MEAHRSCPDSQAPRGIGGALSCRAVVGLVSKGPIDARKVGRDWLIERESPEAYKRQIDELGDQRRNAWQDRILLLERGEPSKEKVDDVLAYVAALVERGRPCWP
jgi:hypothetical protein